SCKRRKSEKRMNMPPKCPECNSRMEWNTPFYVCSACGLSLRRHELTDMYDKLQDDLWDAREDRNQGDKKSKEKRDILDWYLKKKK
ncbi:MAG: hypothetical protein ACFFBD_13995, partial [Candidatus Hodarchaeota archaeon]